MVSIATPEPPPIWAVYRAAGRTVAITWAAACLRLLRAEIDGVVCYRLETPAGVSFWHVPGYSKTLSRSLHQVAAFG